MLLKLKEYQEKLMEGVKRVLESDNFRDFLAFSSKFRRYSFGNTILIWSQNRNSTRVAGFKTWNSLGRRIKKGEKGIVIFAPIIKKARKETSEDMPDDGEEKDALIGFKAVHVWDVGQTEGDPLPELETGEIRPEDGYPESLFERILASSPVPIEVKGLDGEKRGLYLVEEKRIIVSSALNTAEKCKTLLHELAHHMALSAEPGGGATFDGRSAHEVLAEGAAYLACCHFGIDSSEYSFLYLASWEQDFRKILSFGDTSRNLALGIIDIIEGREGTDGRESAA